MCNLAVLSGLPPTTPSRLQPPNPSHAPPKKAVKRGRAALRERLVPAAAVAAWQAKVERAERDVREVGGREVFRV